MKWWLFRTPLITCLKCVGLSISRFLKKKNSYSFFFYKEKSIIFTVVVYKLVKSFKYKIQVKVITSSTMHVSWLHCLSQLILFIFIFHNYFILFLFLFFSLQINLFWKNKKKPFFFNFSIWNVNKLQNWIIWTT